MFLEILIDYESVFLLTYGRSLMNKTTPSSVSKEPGADLGLLAGGSQSVVVICHSTYELGGGGETGDMCRSTYIRVNVRGAAVA